MPVEPEDIATQLEAAIRLFEQGQYQAALDGLQHLDYAAAGNEAIVLWQVRCLFEQGSMREAAVVLQAALARSFPDIAMLKMRLWVAFLTLYGVVVHTSGNPFEAFETAATAADTDPHADTTVHALVVDLRSRVALWRVIMGWEAPQSRPQVRQQVQQAIDAYAALGDWREALRAKLRLADCARQVPYGDLNLATRCLREVCTEAHTRVYPLMEADAHLALAEMECAQALATPGCELDIPGWMDRFERVSVLYQQAGHIFGEAKVAWSWARLLLQYGYTAGATLAHTVAQHLAQQGDVLLQQQIWKALGIWHTHHGNATLAREAFQQSAALSQTMAFPLSHGIDQLTAADHAFRDGRYGESEAHLQAILRDEHLRDIHVAAQLNLANVLARTGRDTQACAVFDLLIARLEQQGGGPLLGEAILSRASIDSTAEFIRQAFDRLLQHDRKEGNFVALGQHLMQWAWMQSDQRRRDGFTPVLTPEIDAAFDAAQTALASCTTLEARMHLGQLWQHRGLVAFIDQRWEACGTYLSQAEGWFRALELLPALAFTLTQQGLVLIQLGRQRSQACYDQAKIRLEEAEGLFTQADMQGVLWQVIFYQALCEREGGLYWETPGSVEQAKRWSEAQHLFQRASAIIDVQRGTLVVTSAVAAQMAGMAFSVDKQQVYGEGFQLAWPLQQDTASALQWLERMKSRALLDALALAIPALPTDSPSVHPLIAQDLTLRQQKRLATDMATVATLQQAIESNRQQMACLPETAGYAALRCPDPPSWPQVRDVLRAVQARLTGRQYVIAQFYHTPQQILLFGMRADWETPRLVPVPVSFQDLRRFLTMWFCQLGAVRRLKNLGVVGQQQWQQFASLIAPLAEWTAPGDMICLIPHHDLHDIPLHTLHLHGMPLAERNGVTYAPSLAVLYHILQRSQQGPVLPCDSRERRAVVFGNPTGDLPHADEEARQVAASMGCVPTLGPAVTRERMLAALTEAEWFVYAGHGQLVADDGFRSRLELANGQQLSAADLCELPRAASVVVLSACETGISEQRAGDERVGMVRAFLLAGTNTVVASQWRVNDAATSYLLRAFCEAMTSGARGPAEALQQATKAVRSRPEWMHFYYWGGFVVYGGW